MLGLTLLFEHSEHRAILLCDYCICILLVLYNKKKSVTCSIVCAVCLMLFSHCLHDTVM